MKCNFVIIILVLLSVSFQSCDKESINPDIDDFCKVKPEGWVCEIIQSDFKAADIPKDAGNPVAIIKYKSLNREFTSFDNIKVNPSLILNLYPIAQKDELIEIIQAQQMHSWCIPVYYGESKEYFIVTSPCFINGGSFTDEAKASIIDLHRALSGILTNTNKELTAN